MECLPASDTTTPPQQLKASLLAVRTVLDNNETPADITLEDLLDKAEVCQDVYVDALKVCSRGNNIVMKRSPSICGNE
jgi:hypothetical protein